MEQENEWASHVKKAQITPKTSNERKVRKVREVRGAIFTSPRMCLCAYSCLAHASFGKVRQYIYIKKKVLFRNLNVIYSGLRA